MTSNTWYLIANFIGCFSLAYGILGLDADIKQFWALVFGLWILIARIQDRGLLG